MISSYDSPVGELILGTCAGSLVLCDYADKAGGIGKSLHKTTPDYSAGDSSIISEAMRQLDEYFTRIRTGFTLPLAFSGSELERRVWAQLMEIPYGTTATYKWVAERCGIPKAVRAVASCIGRNPMSIFVPCHRVIGVDGKLHGYAGGIEAKLRLLSLEGSLIY